MKILTRRFKAVLRDDGQTKTIELGKEIPCDEPTTEAPHKEMIQNASYVANENMKVETILKTAKRSDEEFEIALKYLIE